MDEALIFVPMIISIFILIYYVSKTEGKDAALIFFGFGLIYAIMRELIIGLTFPIYIGAVRIGPLSPGIPIGWVFTFALGFYFIRELSHNTKYGQNVLLKICLGTLFVLGMSLVFEITGPKLGWWTFQADILTNLPESSFLLGVPIFAFYGWANTGLIFYFVFYYLQSNKVTSKTILVSSIVVAYGLASFVIGNYLITTMAASSIQQTAVQLFIFQQLTFVVILLTDFYIQKRASGSTFGNMLSVLLYGSFQFGAIPRIGSFLGASLEPYLIILIVTLSCLCIGIGVIRIYQRIVIYVKGEGEKTT